MEENPNFSISNSLVVVSIHKLMKQTVPHFKSNINSDFIIKKKLNEDDFTQVYLEQAQILIREYDYPFNIGGQYRDITYLSKGFSDLYFYPTEQGVSTASLYSVECKRLPSPAKSRQKEYVIGDKNNGGIERYKTEKHGKGLLECSLIGFIEKKDFTYWLNTINGWIEDLAQSDTAWDKDEFLSKIETKKDHCFLESNAHRKSDDIKLNHLWVKMN